jgi:uncharacterized protein with von Willebrand factor type A (vWA) domain
MLRERSMCTMPRGHVIHVVGGGWEREDASCLGELSGLRASRSTHWLSPFLDGYWDSAGGSDVVPIQYN